MALPFPKTSRFSLKPLLNPYWIAVLASVGVHGLFFAFGPRFSDVSFAAWVEGDTPEEPRNVPLVQLSPEEQSRLPDFSPKPFSLDPNRLSPPGSFTPPSPSTLPTPNTFSGFSNAPLPGTRPPSSTLLPQQPNLPRPLTGSAPSITRFQFPIRQSPQVTRPPSGIRIGAIPTPPGGAPAQTEQPPDSAANPAAGSDSQLPTLPDGETPTLDDLLPSASSDTENPLTGRADALTGTEEATIDPSTQSSEAPEIAAAPEGIPESHSRRLLDDYQFDAAGTSEAEVSAATEQWLATAQEKVGEAELQPGEAELSLNANVLKVCLNQPPTDGLVGVIVGPDGTPQDLSVLGSTGYDILNSQALTAVRNYEFPQSDASAPYQVKIAVDYEAEGCIDQLPQAE